MFTPFDTYGTPYVLSNSDEEYESLLAVIKDSSVVTNNDYIVYMLALFKMNEDQGIRLINARYNIQSGSYY